MQCFNCRETFNMRVPAILTIFFALTCVSVEPARILGVFQMPAISHHKVFHAIWKELSLRGHQLTVVTPLPMKDPSLTNLTEIDVSEPIFQLLKNVKFQEYSLIHNPIHEKITNMLDANNQCTEAMLGHEEFIKIYNNSNEKFDLIICQAYISPTIFSIAAKLDAPFVGITSMAAWIGHHYAMGNPNPPSVSGDMYVPYQGKLTFWERFKMTLYNVWSRLYLNLIAWPECDRIARKYLGNDIPYISDIEKNMSMLFLSTNHITNVPRPTVPNVISYESLHVEPPKPLPKDIKEVLDSAKNGAVYFSLGSTYQSIFTSQEVRNVLLEAFAELPYTILWKFEGDSLPNKPKNVFVKKWMPQQDILAHPNVKVFFGQGGLQSTEETVDRGVPMVLMPYISDQEMITRRLVAQDVAIGLDYLTVTKDDIKKAIVEVAENPKYRENMKKLKELWLDQPMKGIDRVVWWMEYVIRHKGAKHLRSPTADIGWIEYLLIDVILAMIAIVFFTVFVTAKLLKMLLSILKGNNKEQKKKKA